ncbi:MAG: SigB/SigF/SigG family RNA polymerase sigma factor [Dactylosporangium sp.]|nr:SigB/SigF/SigG family RNA polymerase sigma factor [Dactylosporangium sp.]NNJ60264.1 SigB/SigF/SigG family RNA polymerase sigma factor [Dactylosporangium sp.]
MEYSYASRQRGSTRRTAVAPPARPGNQRPAQNLIGRSRTDDEVTELLHRMTRLRYDDPRRRALREHVVRLYLPYAQQLARRFFGLGESLADLSQVAAIGLLKAVDGYDPSYSGGFHAYATPTISGELKRHFRDRCWAVQVPRKQQELRLRISRTRDELTQRLGRSPTVADVAGHLQVGEDQVIEAMVAANGYRPASLHALTARDHEFELVDRLGEVEPGYDVIELRESIGPAVARLPARERKIIELRFSGDLSQSQIAAQLGISQMHVSRLLARSLRQLRRSLVEDR